jgi:hypothetical protein
MRGFSSMDMDENVQSFYYNKSTIPDHHQNHEIWYINLSASTSNMQTQSNHDSNMLLSSIDEKLDLLLGHVCLGAELKKWTVVYPESKTITISASSHSMIPLFKKYFLGQYTAHIYCDVRHENFILAVLGEDRNYQFFKCMSTVTENRSFFDACEGTGVNEVTIIEEPDTIQIRTLTYKGKFQFINVDKDGAYSPENTLPVPYQRQ